MSMENRPFFAASTKRSGISANSNFWTNCYQVRGLHVAQCGFLVTFQSRPYRMWLPYRRKRVAGGLLFLPRFLRIPRLATMLRCAIWWFFSSISLLP